MKMQQSSMCFCMLECSGGKSPTLEILKQRLQKFSLLTQVSTPALSGVLSNIKICLPFQMQSASNLASIFIKIAGSLQLHPSHPLFF